MKIPFNKPFLTGKETSYIEEAVKSGKISGDGIFTKKCHQYFEKKFGFKKTLLTTSCTDALEMSAMLCGIQPGDEVIIPSYTFVSTANAYVLRGAKIIFADVRKDIPNIDETKIEELITPKTKALVIVHYGGIACDMNTIVPLCKKNNLYLIEDAAQAIDSYYNGKPLGSFGSFAAFSFHETKNVISGEGGMLVVNDESMIKRSEIIREKGTNRSAFFRGEVDKYNWVDIGSSFLPSEIIAAFLFAQLEKLADIQAKRKLLWNIYHENLKHLEEQGKIKLLAVPEYATNNAHLFCIICKDLDERERLTKFLKSHDILSVFHYLSLHKSPFYKNQHDGRELPNSDMFSDCLLRLPMYYDLSLEEVDLICSHIRDFYSQHL